MSLTTAYLSPVLTYQCLLHIYVPNSNNIYALSQQQIQQQQRQQQQQQQRRRQQHRLTLSESA